MASLRRATKANYVINDLIEAETSGKKVICYMDLSVPIIIITDLFVVQYATNLIHIPNVLKIERIIHSGKLFQFHLSVRFSV